MGWNKEWEADREQPVDVRPGESPEKEPRLGRARIPPSPRMTPEQALAVAPLTTLAGLLPDEHAAAEVINEHLAQGTVFVFQDASGWQLGYRSPAAAALAAFALAQLVTGEGAGWKRIKSCRRCHSSFIDRTAAKTRKGCDEHIRPKKSSS